MERKENNIISNERMIMIYDALQEYYELINGLPIRIIEENKEDNINKNLVLIGEAADILNYVGRGVSCMQEIFTSDPKEDSSIDIYYKQLVYLFLTKIEGQINIILDCFCYEEPSLRDIIPFFDLLALQILETLELIVLKLMALSSKDRKAYIEDIATKRALIRERLLENTFEDNMAIFSVPEHTRKLVNPIN